MKTRKRLIKKKKKKEENKKEKPTYIYTVTIRFTEKDEEVVRFLKGITPAERGGFIRALLRLHVEKEMQPAAADETKPLQVCSKDKKDKTDEGASVIAKNIKIDFT